MPYIRATYHVAHGTNSQNFESTNLMYTALPSGTTLHYGERNIPVSFQASDGTTSTRTFRAGGWITMDGTCLAKIHPGTPFSIVAGDGAVYHTYELLETPEHYSDSRHMAPDFVDLDREKGHVLMERQEKIIKIPGGLVFSDHGAWKKPGWMANEYCGSPEMRYFALRDCRSSRSGEVLHYHGYEMEPYIGLEGEVRLFVSVDDGYEMLAFRNREGVSETIRGEVVPIKSGDVVIPLPRVRHRILFEQMSYPISMDCINYSAHGLQNYSNNDRVVLEKL